MESANLHHYHDLEDQLVGSSSSSLATTPSSYGIGTTTWTPSILNTNDYNSYSKQQEIMSSQYSSMSPDLSYNWSSTNSTTDLLGQDLQHPRIKEEISQRCYLKYKEILSSPNSSGFDELSLNNDQQRNLMINMKINQLSPGDSNYSNFLSNTVANSIGRGCSQIFPSVNISNLNQIGLTNCPGGSFDMNLQALDLLTSSNSRFNGSLINSQNHQIGINNSSDGFSYGFDHMQQLNQLPLYGSSKVSAPSSKGGAEAKRSSSKMEPKGLEINSTAPKKSRLEARASCPPFKVRKEKLGDRIAALQQLVAPFGKTDTASVLMEAIGYIKFLQNQVETLSVPYMKASRNNTIRTTKGGASGNENHEESKRDLNSRGLCLVPLSCLSYITECGGAAVWPPPNFGGAT